MVIIEGRGSLYGDVPAPRVPCPFLLPHTLVEVHLINVDLDGYSLKGILSPEGRLHRLHIEGVEEGSIVSDYSSRLS